MFDKESVYDEKIAPLMHEILKVCKEENLPMIASFYLKDEDEEGQDLCCTSYILPKEHTPEKFIECKNTIYRKPSYTAVTITRS